MIQSSERVCSSGGVAGFVVCTNLHVGDDVSDILLDAAMSWERCSTVALVGAMRNGLWSGEGALDLSTVGIGSSVTANCSDVSLLVGFLGCVAEAWDVPGAVAGGSVGVDFCVVALVVTSIALDEVCGLGTGGATCT